jgi:hypothetical protein
LCQWSLCRITRHLPTAVSLGPEAAVIRRSRKSGLSSSRLGVIGARLTRTEDSGGGVAAVVARDRSSRQPPSFLGQRPHHRDSLGRGGDIGDVIVARAEVPHGNRPPGTLLPATFDVRRIRPAHRRSITSVRAHGYRERLVCERSDPGPRGCRVFHHACGRDPAPQTAPAESPLTMSARAARCAPAPEPTAARYTAWAGCRRIHSASDRQAPDPPRSRWKR